MMIDYKFQISYQFKDCMSLMQSPDSSPNYLSFFVETIVRSMN